MAKKIKSIADLTPDQRNANRGTERGRGMVERSLRENGAGRSIVVDKNGRIIGGNKTAEAWGDIAGEDQVLEVESDGTRLVVVKRTDLDLDDPTTNARQLAYDDNRTSEVGLMWDFGILTEDMENGVDLTKQFTKLELRQLEVIGAYEEQQEQGIDDFDNDAPYELPGVQALQTDPNWKSDAIYNIPEMIPEMIPEVPENLRTWAGPDATPPDEHDGFWFYNYGSDSLRGLDLSRTIMGFYVDDNRFFRWWEQPDLYTAKAINAGFMAMVSPDYSLWEEAPQAVHIYNIFRARWLGRYFQEAGLPTIPNINWTVHDDFSFVFAGIPHKPRSLALQVQAGGATTAERMRIASGLEYVFAELQPETLLLYGGGTATRKEILRVIPNDQRVVWIDSRSAERVSIMSGHMK